MRGLCTKTHTFSNNLLAHDYDIISLTETWLKESVHNRELFHNNYTCFRKDRDDGRKAGGVLVAVHNTWCCTDLTLYNSSYQHIFLKISKGKTVFLLFCVYIPPQSNIDYYLGLYDLFESKCGVLNSNIIMLGDFNIPEIINSDVHSNISVKVKELTIFANFYNLKNVNNIINIQNKTLDLILTNMNIDVIRESEPLVEEDKFHPALELSVNINFNKKVNNNVNTNNYNFKKANFVGLYSELNTIDWSFLEVDTNVNNTVDLFYEHLYVIMNKYIPKFKKRSSSYPLWFTPEMINLSKHKCFHLKKIKSESGDQQYHSFMYKNARKKLKLLIKKSKNDFIFQTENNISENVNEFWNYIRSKKASENNSTFTNSDNKILSGNEIVTNFANYFSSVYDVNPNAIPDKIFETNIRETEILTITELDVKESINKLLPKRSSGPDLIPPYVLKGCVDVLSKPLCILFNQSLKQNIFPDKWKLARVVPIHKSGDKSRVDNYRPVSILSSSAKVFEQILYKYIYNQVASILTPHQHGFVKSKSTVTNLLILTNFIADNNKSGKQTDVFYLDMSKAFDRIRHSDIIKALLKYGIPANICRWFVSYLQNRQQYVEYDGFQSEFYSMVTGVPQGSNLGPLLFLITINDIPKLLENCNCLMFADDIKLFITIDSVHDCKLLEKNVIILEEWCNQNGLKLNIKKCKIMSYSKKSTITYSYKLKDEIIDRVEIFRDLGVVFDTKLNFNHHIQHIVAQASKNLGFILRMGHEFKNPKTLIILYNSFVRSKLEYASIIWSPYSGKCKKSIETIQIRFLRALEFKLTKIYPKFTHKKDLLRKYGFITLETRRDIISVLFLYRIMNNLVDCPELLGKIGIKVPKVNVRLRNEFFAEENFKNVYSRMSIVPRMVSLYNKILLHSDIDIFNTTFGKFKADIQQIMVEITL